MGQEKKKGVGGVALVSARGIIRVNEGYVVIDI